VAGGSAAGRSRSPESKVRGSGRSRGWRRRTTDHGSSSRDRQAECVPCCVVRIARLETSNGIGIGAFSMAIGKLRRAKELHSAAIAIDSTIYHIPHAILYDRHQLPAASSQQCLNSGSAYYI
jgi:hypothetical protein